MQDPSVYLPLVRDRTLWPCGDLVLIDRLYFVLSSKKPEKNRGFRKILGEAPDEIEHFGIMCKSRVFR
jgi:hypothetical protein